MANISSPSEKEKILLAEKVKLIYEVLCHNDILELVELFYDPVEAKKKPDYNLHRKKGLQRIIRNKTARVSHFKNAYTRLKISKIYFGKKALFDMNFFFSSSLERFEKHLNSYMDYLALKAVGIDLEYKYLYFFDHKDKKNRIYIDNYKVEYLTKRVIDINRGLEINIHHEGKIYKGSIKNDNQQIVINAKNQYDNITILFNVSLLSSSSCIYFDKVLYGIAIGIDDKNQKIPVSKKIVFMKEKLTEKELEKLYLILNETESIEVRENLYALESDMNFDINYLTRYKDKIFKIHSFFSTLKYNKNISTKISEHMVFTEFHAFCELYAKYAKDQNFFLNDRKRIVLELMRFLGMNNSKKVMMVLPLYDDNENIFLYDRLHKDRGILDLLLNLANLGTKFDIVFVVKSAKDYSASHMTGVFVQLYEAGVEFGFVDKKIVERKVNNLDFIYSLEHNFSITKDYLGHKVVFKISNSIDFIKTAIKDFQFLKEEATSYDIVCREDCTLAIDDEVLLKMIGTWYGYFYSSIKDKKKNTMIWKIKYEISNDYSMVAQRGKNYHSLGKLETSLQQTLLSLVCKETKNSHYIVFDNYRIDDIFQVMLYSKEFNSENDMANAGILSKEELSDKLVRELLGEPKELMLVIKPDLSKRIKKNLNNRKVKQLIKS